MINWFDNLVVYYYNYNMKLIPLTKGYFTKVDDDDFEKFAIYRWQAKDTDKKNIRAIRTVYIGKKHNIALSRVIMNAPKGTYVDHINHDTLDNRKSNLRFCNKSQNNYNQKLRSDNTTGYKGVHYIKTGNRRKRWGVIIKKNKYIFLGYYKTKEEAAKIYDKTAKKYFGEFALLNFP